MLAGNESIMKSSEMDKVKKKIAPLKDLRFSAMIRKAKYEATLKELNVLNQSELNKSCTFDITTPEIRQQIIDSLKKGITDYDEKIERYTAEIEELKKLL